MKLDRVVVHTTNEKVDIHSTQAKLQMSSTDTKVNIEQPAAILEMHSEPAKINVDSSQAWRDMGLLTTKESIEQAAQKGMQAVKEGTARRAREGNQMMNIASGQNSIPAIAKGKLNIHPVQSGIKWIPSEDAVKLSYVPGKLDIHITPQQPKFDVKIGDVTGQYTPGNVIGTTVQKASVETNVIKGE